MNNPFQSSAGGSNTAVSPASSGFLADESVPVVNPKPAMKTDAERKARLAAAQQPDLPQAKKSWWKFWSSANQEAAGKIKTSSETSATSSGAHEINRVLERKIREREKIENRHSELLQSVDSMCRKLEETQSRPIEFKSSDILPPIPVETIDALTRSTEQVSGVLAEFTSQLQNAERRDDLMIKSMSKVDSTLGSLQRVNEQSISTMDGVKQVLSGVGTSMTDMQQELKDSAKRYKLLCERMHEVESDHSETVAKLQQRTLLVFGLVGVGLIASLIGIAVS